MIYCLLFGALISPTDPIAVMGILRSAGAPKTLELVISGESLFNDGVGVVLFTLLLGVLASGAVPTAAEVGELLLLEAVGGIALGLVLGYICFTLLKSIDQYQVEVLITLATVMGGYSLASHLHVSGPLAMVVCRLIVGNGGRALAMSDETRGYVDVFWELIDEILNAVLFVLIGLEFMLIARFAMAHGGPACEARGRPLAVASGIIRGAHLGGLHGGISVALALSLPTGEQRDIVLALTYCVVVFSILVQGLTIGSVVRRAIVPSDTALSKPDLKTKGEADQRSEGGSPDRDETRT